MARRQTVHYDFSTVYVSRNQTVRRPDKANPDTFASFAFFTCYVTRLGAKQASTVTSPHSSLLASPPEDTVGGAISPMFR